VGKQAQARQIEPEIEDELGEFEDDGGDPADDSGESAEAHGQAQPAAPQKPAASTPPPAESLLNSAPPPAPVVNRGGPPASSGTNRPEDAIPDAVEAEYAAKGQHKTGNTYAGDQRKFLGWLRAKSLSFVSMPPGSAQQFLTEVYRNNLIRNRAITALTVMFERAQALGINFLPQAMERAKTGRQAKAATDNQQGPPPPAQIGAPINTTAQPAVFGAPAIPAPVVPPKPMPQPPKPPSAFPSLGQRIQISRIADGYQQGVAPGTRIPINTYQKEQIEATGSMENFVMTYLRPVHGPFAGEPPGTYLFQQLDTAARPLPGADWTVTVSPAETGRPQPGGYGQPMQQPATVWQFPNAMAAPAGVPQNMQADLFTRILEREFIRADREAAEARQQRKELEEKREKNGISDMMYFAMLNQIPQPRPVDPVEVARRAKEELDRLQPPAPPAALPSTPSMPDFGAPKEDRVMALLERLLEKQSQPPPPQKDTVMAFGEMLALFERARTPPPPPDPLLTQLAAIALKQVTEPPKSKGLSELIGDVKTLKDAFEMIGGGSDTPTVLDSIERMFGTFMENAPALGEMINSIRTGKISEAFAADKQKRLAAKNAQAKPDKEKEKQPAQPQRVLPTRETQEKLVAMCNGIQNGDEDQKIVENLFGVIQQLESDPDPTGMNRWQRFSQQIVQRYLNAEAPQEIQGMVFWFFEQLGAKKLYSTYPKVAERLHQALTENYSVVYKLLTNGKEKELAPAATTAPATAPAAVAATPPTAAPPADAAPAENAPEDSGEDEDEDDDEDEPVQAAG
jgi:hypothetical protein